MSIRTLIIDDEPLARKRIKRLLADEPDISVIGECSSGREAIRAIQETPPDLLLLDIQMPEVNGFEVLKTIPLEQMPAIIFVTAYDQHALKAFEVHALDYLLKPFKQERFKDAVNLARLQLAKNGSHETNPGLAALIEKLQAGQNCVDRFMVKSSSRVVFVKAAEVDWIESAANYALLHAGEQTHIVRETMHALESKLNPRTFQRISRSLIVNMERIKELQPMGKGQYVIILTNGKRLTMSRGIRDLQQALEPV
ncbi:MAG TPA: LytTR family DNA-binding domain-containing protein [Verrucomicrobiae bacterium]|nr:LytTR family DNA-binding domain-containing protein [Verrucomicrobiae bacterium]